jgi:ornithine carbamoyltransferase
MSAEEHPTQALTDLTTLHGHFGRIEGLRLLYVGEGNNTATALALALSRFDGVELDLRTLPGYGLPAHCGEEVTAEVLDGPAGIAFTQAANKMYSAMAVIEWCTT